MANLKLLPKVDKDYCRCLISEVFFAIHLLWMCVGPCDCQRPELCQSVFMLLCLSTVFLAGRARGYKVVCLYIQTGVMVTQDGLFYFNPVTAVQLSSCLQYGSMMSLQHLYIFYNSSSTVNQSSIFSQRVIEIYCNTTEYMVVHNV